MVYVVLIIWCVILPFESVNEILWCDQFNKASLAILSHGAICFSAFYLKKIETLPKFDFGDHFWQ